MKHLLSPGGLRGRAVLSLAAVAAMLVAFAAPASARAAPAHRLPRHQADVRAAVTFRPASARTGRRAPVARSEAAAPAAFDDSISEDECVTAYSQGLATNEGWAKSRFASCTTGMVVAQKLFFPDGYPGPYYVVGQMSFLLTDINQPSNSDALVTHTRIIDNITISGDMSNIYFDVTTACNNSQPTSGNCNPQASSTNTYAATDLAAAGSSVLVSTFNVDPGTNADQSSYNWTQTTLTAYLNPSGGLPPSSISTTPTGFRCDYATYMSTPGCVIDWAPTPVLFYDSTSNPLVAPVAQHIYDAQNFLLYTPWGKPGYPLTRDANPDDRALNNQTACGGFVPPDDVNTSCDEYPLESTHEGAYFQPDFSIRGVPPSANSSQGGLTGGFYSSQRILDGDAFYVDVILPNGTYSW